MNHPLWDVRVNGHSGVIDWDDEVLGQIEATDAVEACAKFAREHPERRIVFYEQSNLWLRYGDSRMKVYAVPAGAGALEPEQIYAFGRPPRVKPK